VFDFSLVTPNNLGCCPGPHSVDVFCSALDTARGGQPLRPLDPHEGRNRFCLETDHAPHGVSRSPEVGMVGFCPPTGPRSPTTSRPPECKGTRVAVRFVGG